MKLRKKTWGWKGRDVMGWPSQSPEQNPAEVRFGNGCREDGFSQKRFWFWPRILKLSTLEPGIIFLPLPDKIFYIYGHKCLKLKFFCREVSVKTSFLIGPLRTGGGWGSTSCHVILHLQVASHLDTPVRFWKGSGLALKHNNILQKYKMLTWKVD